MRRHLAHLAVGSVLAVAALSGCAALVPRPVAPTPVACNPAPPADASPAAVAYAEATDRALQERQQLSDKIADQDMLMSRDDMRTGAVIDEAFLVDVRAIDFPPEAGAAAETFVLAVEAEGVFLHAAAAEDDYYGAHLDERDRLHGERFRASIALREALGLPPSSCRLNLP